MINFGLMNAFDLYMMVLYLEMMNEVESFYFSLSFFFFIGSTWRELYSVNISKFSGQCIIYNFSTMSRLYIFNLVYTFGF